MVRNATTTRGEKRRADILHAALALFNAHGTQAVSTNHIAIELAISVGNLYWHFPDKEAIVRALYEEQVRKYDTVWSGPESQDTAVEVAARALRRAFAIQWEYRFINRELVLLTRADPELRKLYVTTRERRRGELRAFMRGFVELGVLRVPDGDATLDELEELSWTITSFWLPHVDLRDATLTKRAALDGARAVFALFVPYMTKENGKALMAALSHAEGET